MKARSLLSGASCSQGAGSSMSLAALSLIALLPVVLFVESVEGKVSCYVCSWHSPAHGGQNMTDTCSHYNFDEVYAKIVECDHGCEAVTIRKSKNDQVLNFYKNCKSSDSSKDACTSMEDKNYQYRTTCECSSNLCNSAKGMKDAGRTITGLLFALPTFALTIHFVMMPK